MSLNNNTEMISIEIPKEAFDQMKENTRDALNSGKNIITDRMARIQAPEDGNATDIEFEISTEDPYVTFFTEDGEELSPHARKEKLEDIFGAPYNELLYDDVEVEDFEDEYGEFDGYTDGYDEYIDSDTEDYVSITPISAPFVHPINQVVANQSVMIGLLLAILGLTIINTIKNFFGKSVPIVTTNANSSYSDTSSHRIDEPVWQSKTIIKDVEKKPETNNTDKEQGE